MSGIAHDHPAHPAASVFPMMDSLELARLAEDIRRNGLIEPIIRIKERGQTFILDGRNRLKACTIAGVKPRFEDYDGNDATSFAVSLNLTRRHLNESQRAMVGAKLATLKNGSNQHQKKGSANLPTLNAPSQADAAALVNVAERSVRSARAVLEHAAPEVIDAVDRGELAVSAAGDLAKLPKAKQKAVLARAKAKSPKATEMKPGLVRAYAKQEQKAIVAEKINAEPAPMPTGPFRVIVSDPPWDYNKRAGDATHRGDLPYPSMSTDAICALPVASIAHDEDCILWLWTTNAFMRDAFRVLDAWGFQEKTILTWVKDRMVLGDWLRGQTEHCILAVRGKPTVTLSNETTVLHGPLREHSRKPDEFYALVEKLCPGSKVEMFCREPRKGWAAWGAETEKFDGR